MRHVEHTEHAINIHYQEVLLLRNRAVLLRNNHTGNVQCTLYTAHLSGGSSVGGGGISNIGLKHGYKYTHTSNTSF